VQNNWEDGRPTKTDQKGRQGGHGRDTPSERFKKKKTIERPEGLVHQQDRTEIGKTNRSVKNDSNHQKSKTAGRGVETSVCPRMKKEKNDPRKIKAIPPSGGGGSEKERSVAQTR